MLTPVNRFKEGLKGPAPQLGLWVGLTEPISIEIAAGAGFDWVCLDGEHAPHDLKSLLFGLQTLAAYPVNPVVRIPHDDPVFIKRVLDIGAQTLLVPMVESAQQATDLVKAMRYPPFGVRGVGTALARASRWNRATDYFEAADREMCLLVQIESALGLANAEAIAAVDGVDALFIGPADLAASLGHLGNPGHPVVQEAIRAAFRRIGAAGKPVGSLSADETLAREYLAAGCRFMALGTDTVLLANAMLQLVRRFRSPTAAGKPGAAAGQVY